MSQFVVSARKYRPARFEDVVGQAHVSQTLKNALHRGQIAHAYLFCGPRGIGKTTCARIMARVLNCENRSSDFEACDVCPSCKAFYDNASFNITELDAASNNSVEHIRSLVEQVRFAPQQGKYKIYIIDEVHMLSQGAFNAFLKTLEEPPPYAVFILATTEKHKILPTILSRCQIYDFLRISVADMAAHLQRICVKEEIVAESEALHAIAQKADGALRDALSLFDRIASATGGKTLTYADVVTQLNILDYDFYFKLVDALMAEDLSETLLIFDEVLRKGFEADLFVNGLADHVRHLLVSQDPQTLSLVEAGESLRERYLRQAQLAPTDLLLTALQVLNDCDIQYRLARNKRLHVELALIRLTYSRRSVEIAEPAPEKKKSELSGGMAPSAQGDRKAENPIEQEAPKPGAALAQVKTETGLEFGFTSLNLANIELQVEADANKAAKMMQELSLGYVSMIWQDYLQNATYYAKESLSSAIISLTGEEVTIMVGSELARSYLEQDKPKLRTKILSEIDLPALNIIVTVDQNLSSANAVEPLKKMTVKDKYLHLLSENALLETFTKRFGLKDDRSDL